jgi:hypothetical protein
MTLAVYKVDPNYGIFPSWSVSQLFVMKLVSEGEWIQAIDLSRRD